MINLLLKVMVYTRAAASDYDDWENVFGNPGWGSKDLIPLLKKVEIMFSPAQLDIEEFPRQRPTR